jgi:hypothetical protein
VTLLRPRFLHGLPAHSLLRNEAREFALTSNKLFSALVIACAAAGAIDTAAQAQSGTTVGGKAYIDLTRIDKTSDGMPTNASGVGVDVKRFYLSVGHVFDDTWSANLTTDFNYVSNDRETQLFVKKAFLQAHFSDAFVLRVGSADLPWVPFVENLYGYRHIETVIDEYLHFATSADWGVHAVGAVAGGKLNYAVSGINGRGYKDPTRSRSLDWAGRLSFSPVEGLVLAAGLRTGKAGLEQENVPSLHTAKRYDLLAAYVRPEFRVGAQYFRARNWNQVLTIETDEADGYSLWGSFNVKDDIAVFARYDDASPSETLRTELNSTYFNLGVSYAARPGVDIALVYKHNEIENGFYDTSNGVIGGLQQGEYGEIGIWAQVEF